MERTLSIIKPDATKRNITGKINSIIEDSGLRIIAQKMLVLSKNTAEAFYAEHKGKVFFDSMIAQMISAPVVVQVLEGKDAISSYRQIMGATNPANAEDGTIRKQFAIAIDQNSVHGSDSVNSAVREINFFFSDIEICG